MRAETNGFRHMSTCAYKSDVPDAIPVQTSSPPETEFIYQKPSKFDSKLKKKEYIY